MGRNRPVDSRAGNASRARTARPPIAQTAVEPNLPYHGVEAQAGSPNAAIRVVVDWVFAQIGDGDGDGDGEVVFLSTRAPMHSEIAWAAAQVSQRVKKMLQREGLLCVDQPNKCQPR